MIDTFDTGPVHIDVDTETGALHIRYATVGYYKADMARKLLEFLAYHYADLSAKPAPEEKKNETKITLPAKG